MIHQTGLQSIISQFSPEQLIAGAISIILAIVFLLELRKYLKYRAFPDVMELSGIATMATGLFAITGDLLLSGLAGILAMMIIGSFEIRENPIWFRMMITFTISYGFFFIMVVLGFITTKTFPLFGEALKDFLISIGFSDTININQFFVGIGYNLVIYIMILTALIIFGKKFIIVTRFISPQMVYLVLYLIALLFVLGLKIPEAPISIPFPVITNEIIIDLAIIAKYAAIFVINILIYLFSGPLITFLFGIKPLEDERVEKIIEEVQVKVQTPVRKIGIVKAPILNAFAYGPWFDQRIAYMASDLDVFTDSEIRGITAHELVHVKRKHTLLLLGLTAVELIIKYFIDAPSTYWEYVLGTNQTWDFLSFWLFNICLFALLSTFIKMLEGEADRITRELGFGKDLAHSLYRLEGFYYGIAGEIGFNTQLMTGKTRSEDENIRFMGDQAFYLYQNLAPSRLTCFMNLIASHPLTSIRLALQVDRSIGAIETGITTWLLLIPGLRKRKIRKLQRNRKQISELLSEKYSTDFGTIGDYLEITFEESMAKHYLSRTVLARPRLTDETAYWGKLTGITRTNNIVSPLELEIETTNGSHVRILKNDYEITIAEPQHNYIDKKGQIATLNHVSMKKGKFKKFHYLVNGKTTSSRSIGLDIVDFQNHSYWLVYKNGMMQPWNLKDVLIAEKYKDLTFVFEDDEKKEYQYLGKDLVVEIPPFLHMINPKNWKKEKLFFKRLYELNEPVILYDKEDIDIGAPIKITDVSLSNDEISILEGRTKKSLLSKKIDTLILYYPFFLINFRKEMGIGNIISLKIFNRGIRTKYIGL
ncbi:MAG: M48 family metalloprotease [Candidatus Hodarchaeales archaeon]